MSTDITTNQAQEQSGASVPATQGDAAASTYLDVTRPGSRAARAFKKNFGLAPFNINELARVKVPGGGHATWVFETVNGEESAKEIEGVIVGMAWKGALWQDEGEDLDGDRLPVLSATSPWGMPLTAAVRPGEGEEDEDFGDIDPEVLEQHKLGEIDGVSVYDWQSLPYTQWGSSSKGSGNGKRAKEKVHVYLLRKHDTLPLCITIPAASVSDWGKAIRSLRYSYDECIVGLSLEKVTPKSGPAYSRVVPRYIDELTEEEGAAIAGLMGETIEASVREQCLPFDKVAALIAGK